MSVWKIVSDKDWAGLGEEYQEHIHIPRFYSLFAFSVERSPKDTQCQTTKRRGLVIRKSFFVLGRSRLQMSARRQAILAEVCRVISQSIQTNSGLLS